MWCVYVNMLLLLACQWFSGKYVRKYLVLDSGCDFVYYKSELSDGSCGGKVIDDVKWVMNNYSIFEIRPLALLRIDDWHLTYALVYLMDKNAYLIALEKISGLFSGLTNYEKSIVRKYRKTINKKTTDEENREKVRSRIKK